ncbi:hypothetical protein BaRGS_00016874 [Batillaria attramentaria]|uniref:ERI1 exoribonuclease 2 n=1 Tax=Batillaria attramentaria TaxID=370345 RepID=A0ABD0KXF7_9CAEN
MKTTKQLARELGLLRKRSLSKSTSETDRLKRQKSSQQFSYLIVIDFESTCWENDKTKTQEIIEFPAVLLNTTTGEVESEFHFYLQPQEHPTLSTFCRQLTGITQDQVDNGIPLSLCLRKFSHWLHQLSQEKSILMAGDPGRGSTGEEPTQPQNIAAFVTWSDWDLGVCLHYELRRKQIAKAPCFSQWIDLRATYTKFYGRKPKGLNGALQDVGIEFEGREHSGLHDSRNTAKLAWRMIRDGCIMKITKTLSSASSAAVWPLHHRATSSKTPGVRTAAAAKTPKKRTPTKNTGKKTPQKVTPAKTTPSKMRSTKVTPTKAGSSNHEGKQPTDRKSPPFVCYKDQGEDSQNTPMKSRKSAQETSSKALLSASTGLKIRNSNISEPKQAIAKGLRENTNICNTAEKSSKTKEESVTPNKCMPSSPACRRTSPRLKAQKQHVPSSESSPRNKACQIKRPTTEGDAETLTHGMSVTPGLERKTAGVMSGLSTTPTSSAPFKHPSPPGTGKVPFGVQTSSVTPRLTSASTPVTHKAPSGPQHQLCHSSTPSFTKNQMSSFLHTPSPQQNSTGFGSFRTPLQPPPTSANKMKATPPLCRCGRRAKRRMVQNPGPNMGRWFFSCGKGTQSPGSGDSKKSGCSFFQWEPSQRTPSAASQSTLSSRGAYRSYSNVSKPFTPVLNVPGSMVSNRKAFASSAPNTHSNSATKSWIR